MSLEIVVAVALLALAWWLRPTNDPGPKYVDTTHYVVQRERQPGETDFEAAKAWLNVNGFWNSGLALYVIEHAEELFPDPGRSDHQVPQVHQGHSLTEHEEERV